MPPKSSRAVALPTFYLLLSAVASSLGTSASARAEAGITPSQFIVVCKCADVAAKNRLAAAIERRGGTILYVYHSQSLAVAAPRGRRGERFEAKLVRLPNVVAVSRAGVSHLSTPT